MIKHKKKTANENLPNKRWGKKETETVAVTATTMAMAMMVARKKKPAERDIANKRPDQLVDTDIPNLAVTNDW